jgi:PilZ domain
MSLVPVVDLRPSVFAQDRRFADRIDVAIWTRLQLCDEIEDPIRITNISTAGMMGMTPCDACEGTRVTLKLPELGWIDGRVAWRLGDRIGIEFRKAIIEADFLALTPYCL